MHPDRFPESPAARKLRLFLEAMGEKRGRTEGRAEGLADGQRKALLLVLKERGLAPTAAQHARIEACTSVAELSTWLKRAVTAESLTEVLGPRTAAKSAPRRRSTTGRPVRRAKNGASSPV